MRRKISYGDGFVRDIKSLQKRFPIMKADVLGFQRQIEAGQVIGDRMSGFGKVLYKARLGNRSAKRGKSGGFPAIYYREEPDTVVFVHIYSKKDKNDASHSEIIERLRDID